ncbi:MAG: beta-lactamase family protein [Acidobacteria bacterium]|nr:beta-lactamase family protein [Acidobacteriota bacterium]
MFALLPFICATIFGQTASDKSSAADALFRDFDRADAPGASFLVVRRGRVVYEGAFGMANLEEKTPATTATNFRLASVTKQFTAMSVLMLVERKRLTLDTKLTEVFPDFPAYGSKITIRHLLTHTSGLADYEDLIPESATVPLRDKQVLELLKTQTDTTFAPGSRFSYSNSGYAVLALVVEKVSGVSFATFLRENIFKPLGMANTVAFENGVSTVNNRAYGYTPDGHGGFRRHDQSLTSSVLGDGGVYSSVEDLRKWDAALYTEKLVRPATLAQAFTAQVPNSDQGAAAYGFGWYVETYRGRRAVWHYGSTVGFRTAIVRFPDERSAVVVLLNRDGTDAHALALKLADLFLFDAK